MRVLDVCLGDPDGSDFNTIVFAGVDLEIPLEADLDGDPLHDDEVRLVAEHGGYDAHLCANEPDVRHVPDKNVYVYRFRDVPPGLYRVLVRVADQGWATVMSGLVVHRSGARLGGKELTATEPEAIDAGTDELAEPVGPDAALSTRFGEYVDVADNYFEED